MLQVTDSITIEDREIQEDFILASGPGGQNVNKVATAVQLRFDAAGSPSLPEGVRERLLKLAEHRITKDGVLLITARTHRTQEQNRRDARERLVSLIRQAATPRKHRVKTRPSGASRERRLQGKHKRAHLKKSRGHIPHEDH